MWFSSKAQFLDQFEINVLLIEKLVDAALDIHGLKVANPRPSQTSMVESFVTTVSELSILDVCSCPCYASVSLIHTSVSFHSNGGRIVLQMRI